MGGRSSKAKVHHAESRAEEERAKAQRAEEDACKAREEAANAPAIAKRELQAKAEATMKAAEEEAERIKKEAEAAAAATMKAAEEEAERMKKEAEAAAEANRRDAQANKETWANEAIRAAAQDEVEGMKQKLAAGIEASDKRVAAAVADARKAREEAANAPAIAKRELQAKAEATMKAGKEEAERMKKEAEAEAEATIKAAEEEAEGIKKEAEAKAEATMKAGKEEAERMKKEAEATLKAGKEESERMKKEAEVAAEATIKAAEEEAEGIKKEAEATWKAGKEEAERMKKEAEVAAEATMKAGKEETERMKKEAALAAEATMKAGKEETERMKKEAEVAAEATMKGGKEETERMKKEAEVAAEGTRKAGKEETERMKKEAALAAEVVTKATEEAEKQAGEEAERMKKKVAAADGANRKVGKEEEETMVKEAGVAAPAAQPEALSLRVEFNKFADATDEKGEPCMSRAGLEGALTALNITKEVDYVMTRFDMNRDGLIDFTEFQLIKNSEPALEMLVRSFGLEGILAALLPKGTMGNPLAGFFSMTDADVDALAAGFQPLIVACFKGNIQRGKDAEKAMEKLTSAAGAKFANPLQGGDIDFYHKGVTAIVGEPHANLEEGVKEEHTTRATCDKEFSTANYGITTTPRTEYNLVMGPMVEDVSAGGAVEVKGTRRSKKKGGEVQKDERVLRPLQDYGAFREDGRLAVAPGGRVLVGEDFEAEKDEEYEEEVVVVKKSTEGNVLEINAQDGSVTVDFHGIKRRVKKPDVDKLHPQPSKHDSPVKRLVKLARLTRVEVMVLVLYTGLLPALPAHTPLSLPPWGLGLYVCPLRVCSLSTECVLSAFLGKTESGVLKERAEA